MMKNLQKMLFVAVAMTAISTASFAQTSSAVATATASASATIITPITITKNTDLNFGNVVSTTTGGTVTLSAALAAVRTESGVQLPAVAGTVSAAAFTITGQTGYAYSVTLPTTPYTITSTTLAGGTAGATEQMTLSNFVASTSGTLTGGTQSLYVGATLNVVAGQLAGTYIGATDFNVSVNYN